MQELNNRVVDYAKNDFDAIVLPTTASRKLNTRYEELFSDYKCGLRPNLGDPIEAILFKMHLCLNLNYAPFIYSKEAEDDNKLNKIDILIQQHSIPDRPHFPTIYFQSGPHLDRYRLRPLSLYEAPFRSFIGDDCGTTTKFTFPLEFAYQHFALERLNNKKWEANSLGQLEVVLENSPQDPKGLIHRIQIPLRSGPFSTENLLCILEALRISLDQGGFTLCRYPTNQQYDRAGHMISNQIPKSMLDAVFDNFGLCDSPFTFNAAPFKFNIHPECPWEEMAERLVAGVEVVPLFLPPDCDALKNFDYRIKNVHTEFKTHDYRMVLQNLIKDLSMQTSYFALVMLYLAVKERPAEEVTDGLRHLATTLKTRINDKSFEDLFDKFLELDMHAGLM